MAWCYRIGAAAVIALCGCGLAAAADVVDPVREAQARRACLEGLGVGTDLLPVVERIAGCTALSEIDGARFDGLFYRARARISDKDWAGAVADYSAALELRPDAEDAVFERGRVRFLYLGTPAAALEDFTTTAELAPSRAEARMMQALAAIELARGSDGEAVTPLVETARAGLLAFLDLTEGSEDPARKIERDAALDILRRLSQGQ